MNTAKDTATLMGVIVNVSRAKEWQGETIYIIDREMWYITECKPGTGKGEKTFVNRFGYVGDFVAYVYEDDDGHITIK